MGSEIIIYKSENGQIKVDARFEEESVWLTQAQMAKLFGKSRSTVTEHINNIFIEGELVEDSVRRKFRLTAEDGKTYETKHYNLDVIISVGYRVKSLQGTQFRIWATNRLREYIVKGFVLNDDHFKNGESLNYFSELQDRIREIRLSERFFYQKIKDIYTTSIDYDSNSEQTVKFFKVVQNKLLWAISKQTAAELVYRRVNIELPLLGMQSFDRQGGKLIRKSDVSIAKNYLNHDEIKLLGLIVEQYLAFAEVMAQQKTPMYMTDWINRLDGIIQMNGRELLDNAGEISHKMALERSTEAYETYKEEFIKTSQEQSIIELELDIRSIEEELK